MAEKASINVKFIFICVPALMFVSSVNGESGLRASCLLPCEMGPFSHQLQSCCEDEKECTWTTSQCLARSVKFPFALLLNYN